MAGGCVMPTLFVRCRACGTEFPTRLAVGAEEQRTLVVSGLSQRCPACGVEELYYTKDVFAPARDEDTGARTERAERPSGSRFTSPWQAGARVWAWLGLG